MYNTNNGCFIIFDSMASLLSKFRIDYSDLRVITDITKKPHDDTVSMFETLIKDLMSNEDDDDDGGEYKI